MKYENPQIAVIHSEAADVITTSDGQRREDIGEWDF